MSRAEVVVCSIGSTDPWNAAGLGLDVRALAACGARPVSVVAGVTAQDRTGIAAAAALPGALVTAQLRGLAHAGIAAYRIGALLDVATVAAIAEHLATERVPVVFDPVLAASAGGSFADRATIEAILELLVPQATLLTPNLAEAAALTGAAAVDDIAGMEAAGAALRGRGAGAVLVKGGHLRGAAIDVLVTADQTIAFEAERLTGTLRGTGCLLACAVAAELARGAPLSGAVETARAFVRARFATAHHVGGMNVAY
jgi:hydroxymethylpyrimidine/phosphomethylpyrimidine kinase